MEKKDSQIKHKPRTSFSLFRHKSEDYIKNARLITYVTFVLVAGGLLECFFCQILLRLSLLQVA